MDTDDDEDVGARGARVDQSGIGVVEEDVHGEAGVDPGEAKGHVGHDLQPVGAGAGGSVTLGDARGVGEERGGVGDDGDEVDLLGVEAEGATSRVGDMMAARRVVAPRWNRGARSGAGAG